MRNEQRRVANTLRVERAERLEGSRFVAGQLYGSVAGGSRERLEVWQFYRPVVSAPRNRRDGQNIALGHSREPPAYQPIELPRYKAAPLQGGRAIPYAGPKPLFEYEYEDDNRRRQRLRAPIDSFDSHRIFFN